MDNYSLLFDYKDSEVTNNYDPNQCMLTSRIGSMTILEIF